MKTSTMMTSTMPRAPVGKAWEEVSASFDRYCLAARIETLGAMMEGDAEVACGHGIRAARTGAVIAGGAQRARSASTLARSQSSGLEYAGSTEKNCRWQAGGRRSMRTG
jgi:hypothetical protein